MTQALRPLDLCQPLRAAIEDRENTGRPVQRRELAALLKLDLSDALASLVGGG